MILNNVTIKLNNGLSSISISNEDALKSSTDAISFFNDMFNVQNSNNRRDRYDDFCEDFEE